MEAELLDDDIATLSDEPVKLEAKPEPEETFSWDGTPPDLDSLAEKARIVVNAALDGEYVSASRQRAALSILTMFSRVKASENGGEETRGEFEGLLGRMAGK